MLDPFAPRFKNTRLTMSICAALQCKLKRPTRIQTGEVSVFGAYPIKKLLEQVLGVIFLGTETSAAVLREYS